MTALKTGQLSTLERALDSADPAIRLYLLHGPDEAGSRALAARLGKALGAEAERIDLTGAALKADPARLADEAAAIALFGGPRFIRIDPCGDEAADAVAALLEAAIAGNPAVALAGTLRKESKLLKLATASPAALAFASYVPEGDKADRLVTAMGRERGLSVRNDVAQRLATATGGDRALIAQELDKFALYLDADAERPKPLEHDALDALGTGAEGDLDRLVGAVMAGEPAAVDAELGRLAAEATEGVPVARALGRRLLLLAQLRAQMAQGDSVERVMQTAGRGIFWKEQAAVQRQLARWSPAMLAEALERTAAAERALKSSGTAGEVLLAHELLVLARGAARKR